MAGVVRFENTTREFARDKQIVALLVAGADAHRVAEELGITKAEVYEAHTRMMGAVPPDYRARALDLQLRTIDAMKRAWWNLAISQDTPATVRDIASKHVERLEDMRAERVGLKQLPSHDDALHDLKQGETSTENLRRVFLEMRGKYPPTIDGEAKVVDEGEPPVDVGPE